MHNMLDRSDRGGTYDRIITFVYSMYRIYYLTKIAFTFDFLLRIGYQHFIIKFPSPDLRIFSFVAH